MAQFPALTPSAAPITPGAWPATAASSLNGAESRVRHGSAEIGRRLRLQFANITEADFLLIVAHYREQRSGFDSFGFATATLAADLTPAGFAWLYAGPPQVVDDHADCFTVTCEFRCEPRGLVVAPGRRWRSTTTLTPGERSDGVSRAAGKAWTTSFTTLAPNGADIDALSYLTAVELADGQALESATREAVVAFVVGCKADGIWDAIKASCILAGARTLAGAMVPLAGTAPTRNGTESGWSYNRKTGLQGDGSSNWINSNRNSNADPQDDHHIAVYATTRGSNLTYPLYIGAGAATGGNGTTQINPDNSGGGMGTRNRSSNFTSVSGLYATIGLLALNRSSSSEYSYRFDTSTGTISTASQTPVNLNYRLLATENAADGFSNARLSFYSIGESLDLGLLRARVSDLMTAFAAAIP